MSATRPTNASELARARDEVVATHGPWISQNIHLGHGVYTLGPPEGPLGGNDGRLRRIMQLCADLAGPIDGLRIADLGSGEGNVALELAARGAQVVALEGREDNLAKIRLAKTALALDSLELVQDDVRNFTAEKYGMFDIVTAVGIVYHLDVPEVFDFLENIRGATKRFAIIDGKVTGERRAADTFNHRGVGYRGSRYREPVTSDPHDRDELWASIGNPYSFVFTRDALMDALIASGFTTALECHAPGMPVAETRVTVLATCGEPQRYVIAPTLHEAPMDRAQELHLIDGWHNPSPAVRMWSRLPGPAKRAIRSLARR